MNAGRAVVSERDAEARSASIVLYLARASRRFASHSIAPSGTGTSDANGIFSTFTGPKSDALLR